MRISEQKQKLITYFKKNLKKGYTEESLRWALVNQGYSRTIVEESLVAANKELSAEAPVLKEKPVIKYEAFDMEDNPVEINKPWWKRFLGI